MSDQSDWLSLGEAAALLGVHPTTLRHWADQGDLPSQRTPGGHRRFQRRVVEQWLTRPRAETGSGEAQLIMQAALGHARMQIGSGQLDGLPWYDRMNEDARQTHRAMGRRLLELLTRYLANDQSQNRTALLHEAQALGAEYARTSAGQELTLTESVQAFLLFRDLLVDSVIQLAEVLSLRTPADWGERLRQVNHITDELLLALIEEFPKNLSD